MTFSEIQKHIESKVENMISIEDGKNVIFVLAENWKEVSRLLKDDVDLEFNYLMCISSYDKGDKNIYGVAVFI